MWRIHAARHPGETQVALLCGGVLTEFYIHRPAAPDGAGALHVARVLSVVPAMGGAFLALVDAEGFLPDTEGAAGLTAGAHVVVRVTRAPQGGKGPRLTAKVDTADIELAGAVGAPVRKLRDGPSPLDELRAAYDSAAVTSGPFPEELTTEIEALAQPDFTLPGGMRGTATAAAALTAIDLDGGSATAVRGGKGTAQFAANRHAIPEVARQIRLRNFGGAILIDFAGMPAKRRPALGPVLQAALAEDRLAPRLVGFSGLGFAEILRPRRRAPLHEMLRGPLAAGLAALRQAAAEDAASPARRLVLRGAPGVVAALQGDPAALADLARVMTYPLILRSDPALPGTHWTLEDVTIA